MIGKIFNWVAGSFFRTLGRFLFYIVVGALVFFVIGWFKEVNAATYSLENEGTAIYWHNGNYASVNWGTNYYSADNLRYDKFVSNMFIYENKENEYYPFLNPGTYAIEFYVFGIGGFYDITCDNLSSNFQNINMTSGSLVSNEIASSCVDIYKTTYLGMDAYRILYKFTYKGDSATGTENDGQINEIRFTISSNVGFFGSLERGINYGLDISPIQDYTSELYSLFQQDKSIAKIITNGTAQLEAQKETNDKLDETNDHLGDLNENITSDDIDTSKSDSFFNNFTSEDNGGISGVVTAPLRFIQKMTNKCEPLQIPLFEETISFPCGDEIFWNREDVQTFRTTWNILFGGVIIYGLMLKLFKVIQNLKDPDNSKVEVMKL